MDIRGWWDQHLALAEFAYNNNYHSYIEMAPYNTLYRRRCLSLIGLFETFVVRPRGTNLILDLLDRVRVI